MCNPEQNDLWWQQPLIRHLAVVLAVKLILIFGLWWLFFNLPEDHEVDAGQVASHITGGMVSPKRLDLETMK
jgi:hypothetical protein